MKKYFLIIILFTSIVIAQDKNIVDNTNQQAVQDTVRISDLVQQQIQKALEKQIAAKASVLPETLPEKIKIPVESKIEPAQSNLFLGYWINQPVHFKIFEIVSVLIVVFVSFRRIIQTFKKRSLKVLKQKISMLREEKVRSIVNPKLQLSRQQLRGKEMVFMKSDRQISKTARELNISKGELLLAARLKLFEVGKM
jgi:hypothetical protein